MKPLVYYCRWHDASLRLRGRDDTAVWGHLVYKANTTEEWMQEFRFALKTRQITLKTPDGEETLQLDEMGTVQSED
ncbi:hypothetical protein [Candidatus Leptofilum sp.]|uniref:hypothetical protein n=1 Tax=Candidatus Leptofilum sp. TaxID=3241576 RepID=UPI003B5C9489